MSVTKSLTKAYRNAKELHFNQSSKIVIISDCHRGSGTWADNFLNNQNLFFAALTYYYDKDFTYIELGDGDELWENRRIDTIASSHSNSFWLMSKLYNEGRLHMLYGNHDMIKKYTGDSCYSCETDCPCNRGIKQSLFPGIEIHESLILKDENTENSIFLIHGHQGDLLNDRLWRFARFLVRYVWKPMELMGFHDPTSAAKNYRRKKASEKRMAEWSKENSQMMIAGHTHRPSFPKPGETPYFNDGSCVHPRCITAMEIENGTISLVKWSVKTREDRTLYVGKQLLEGPVSLREYFDA